jgi:anti-sigma factor ChrR (cupin superfamily)
MPVAPLKKIDHAVIPVHSHSSIEEFAIMHQAQDENQTILRFARFIDAQDAVREGEVHVNQSINKR